MDPRIFTSVAKVKCTIQKNRPNSITKFGTVYCRRNLDSEHPAPEDSSDVLQNVENTL